MKKVLVLGSGAQIFLSVVRSLGRGGVQVHSAWTELTCLSRRSRYLFQAHDLPPYRDRDPAWKEALARLMAREHFDLVVPCTEREVIACQRHRADLERCGRVYLLEDRAYRVLFDKLETTTLARAVGVPVPRELMATRPEQVEEVLAQFRFPIVLKPRRSLDPVAPGAFLEVRKAYTEPELRALLPAMVRLGEVAVQENFQGDGVGVELLLDAGEPLLAFQHVRLHEPLHGGPSSYRQSVPLTPELLEAALKILRPLRYTGVAMAEFKVNPRTGAWVFLEVNARFWGSLPLAVAAGADFPLALFRFLVDGQTRFPRAYRLGICCRNWSLDLDWQRANWSADHTDPTLATRPLGRVLGETCLNLLSLRERSDTFTLDDPGPGLAELGQWARRVWGRLWGARRGARGPAAAPVARLETSPRALP